MPCNYKKKKALTFKEDLQKVALLAKHGTEPLRKVSHTTTGISHTTLSRWVNNKNTSNFESGLKFHSFTD